MKLFDRQLPERADFEIAMLVAEYLRKHGYAISEREVGLLGVQAGRNGIAFKLEGDGAIRSVVWVNDARATNGHRLAVYAGVRPRYHNEELSAELDEPLFEIMKNAWMELMSSIRDHMFHMTEMVMPPATTQAIIRAWLTGRNEEIPYGDYILVADELNGRILTVVDQNYDMVKNLTDECDRLIGTFFNNAHAIP